MLRSKSGPGGGGAPLLWRATDRSSPKMDELRLRSKLTAGGGGSTLVCRAADRATPKMDELILRSKLSAGGGAFWVGSVADCTSPKMEELMLRSNSFPTGGGAILSSCVASTSCLAAPGRKEVNQSETWLVSRFIGGGAVSALVLEPCRTMSFAPTAVT